MNIQKVPVSKINPAKYNPRIDLQPNDPEYEKIKRSIEEFDLVEPLVWNEKTGNLVGGHQRFKILVNDMKREEIEVSVVNLSLNREKALNLALNRLSGDWDREKLAELLGELEKEDFDLSLTGFGSVEVDELLNSFKKPDLEGIDIEGEDTLTGRLLLVYRDEAERRTWLQKLGINEDSPKVVFTMADLVDE